MSQRHPGYVSIRRKIKLLTSIFSIIFVVFTLVACGDDSGGGSGGDSARQEYPMGSDGGVIAYTSPDNPEVELSMSVPQNAVADGTVITVEPAVDYPDDRDIIPGLVFEFGPDGLVFNSPVELVITYDPDNLNGVPEAFIVVYKETNGVWEQLPSTVDTANKTVTAQITGFSGGGVGRDWDPPRTTPSENWGWKQDPIDVALDCDDHGGSGCDATYYTLDGSDPTVETGTEYTSPIHIAETTDLRFFSVDLAGNSERPRTYVYDFRTEFEGPTTTADPPGQNCSEALMVSLVCDDGAEGSGCASTYYTTDGNPPNVSSQQYTTPIQVSSTMTLRFFSKDNDGNIGSVGSALYLFGDDQDADPPTSQATPPGGTYDAVQEVTLSCDDGEGTGCRIYYTLDGEDPTTDSFGYSVPLHIQQDRTLKFFAVDYVGNAEPIHTEEYVIDLEPKYYVGGDVNGLDGTVVLQNNGADNLSITGSGTQSFLFSTPLLDNEVYAVTVLTHPEGQTCTPANGSGTINGASVQNVIVTCVSNTYTVGGAVAGLIGSLTLQNNGADDRIISDNGGFTFASTLLDNDSYDVSVSAQPVGQTCGVANGSGTIAGSNVDNVSVTCVTGSNYHTIGGTVSGLSGTLVLQNNGADDLEIQGNGTYIFDMLFAESESYSVSVLSAPATQTCEVANPSGTIADSDIEDVNVTCTDIGGTVSGQAILGPIGGGEVDIYDVTDLSDPVFEALTADTNDLTTAGVISILPETFQDASLYLVVVSGGEDIDPDDNGIVNIPATPVAGKIHALIPGSQIKAGGWYVSVLTEKAFRTARYLLMAAYDNADIIASLDTSAESLLTADLNSDGLINHLDLNLWHPIDHAGDTQLTSVVRNTLARKVHSDEWPEDDTGLISSLDVGEVEAIEVIDNRAYILTYPCTFNIVDISEPGNPDIIGQKLLNSFCDSLDAVAVAGNSAFVVGSGNYGFHVLDITDPADITSISYNSFDGSDEEIDNCDDISVKDNVAYITNWGGWTVGSDNRIGPYLMAIDVSNPTAPRVMDIFYPEYGSDSMFDILMKDNSLYFLTATHWQNADNLQSIIDITNPEALTKAGDFHIFSPYNSTVNGNYLYSRTAEGLKIFDISTPASPVLLSTFQHPAYDQISHRLMYLDFHGPVQAAGNRVYIAGNERLHVIDVSTPESPRIEGFIPYPDSGDAFHLSGGLAFVGANNGLHVLDVTDPAPRGIVGSVEIIAGGVEVLGDTAFSIKGISQVNDPVDECVFPEPTPENPFPEPICTPVSLSMDIVDLSDPSAPQLINEVFPEPPDGWPSGEIFRGEGFTSLAATGNHVFVGPVLHVVDVSVPSVPQVIHVGRNYNELNHFDVAIGSFSNLFMKGPDGLAIFDYTDPANLEMTDSTGIPFGYSLAVGTAGADREIVYFEDHNCSTQDQRDILIAHAVDSLGNLTDEGQLPEYYIGYDECVNDIAVSGNVVIVPVSGDWGDYIYSLDISAYPSSFEFLDKIDAQSNDRKHAKVKDGKVYVASAKAGMHIVDINPDGTLTPAALVKTPGVAFDIAFFGDYGVIADGNALVVIRLPVQEVP